jgi:hypothetical protein
LENHVVKSGYSEPARATRASFPGFVTRRTRTPALSERLGDPAARTEKPWVELSSGPDSLAREWLARKLNHPKAKLAGPDPIPLEPQLAERAAACSLLAGFADAAMAQAKGGSLEQAAYLLRR